MGGNDGIRGYIVQTIIAVLDSLEERDDWLTIKIEPNTGEEYEKVDILFTYESKPPLAIQVKSTRRVFRYAEVDKWCAEIASTVPEDHSKELVLVGKVAQRLFGKSELHGVLIPEPQALNIDALMDSGLVKIEKFYTRNGRPNLNINLRELLLKALVADFSKNSIVGEQLPRDKFESNLLSWIVAIEDQIKQDAFVIFTSIGDNNEKVTYSHLIASKILQLIGWEQLGENETINWIDKETNEDQNLTIDFLGELDNELKSNSVINLVLRVFGSTEYPSDPSDFIKNIYKDSHSIWRELRSKNIVNVYDDQSNEFFDLTFWFSTGLNDSDRYYVTEFFEEKTGKSLMSSESNYLFIDNAKADFLISSIITARAYRKGLIVKYLYPITQDTITNEKIGRRRGSILPVQYITSSVIPVVMEDENKISFLLFCSDSYSQDNLRKLIWLTIKLTSGFANEYVIYFPDYDSRFDNEVKATIRSFKNNDLSARISVGKIEKVNNGDLASMPKATQLTKAGYEQNNDLQQIPIELSAVNTLFTDYLPYGDDLRPVLNSNAVETKDLKIFLAKRGVFFKNSSKKKIIDFMTGLLFSPNEIESFRSVMAIKERPPKITPIATKLEDGVSLENILVTLPQINPTKISDGLASKIIGQPTYETQGESIKIGFQTQYNDPTNHISVNTVLGNVEITMRIEDGLLKQEISTVTTDDKHLANRIIKNNWESLNRERLVFEDSRMLMFSDFISNTQRVQFLLSFTNVESSNLFNDQDIIDFNIQYDDTLEIPDEFEDKTNKNLRIRFKGNNLHGLNEISKPEMKEIILLEEIVINFVFNWKGVVGEYFAKFNFEGALNSKIRDGKFQYELKLKLTKKLKNMSNRKNLEVALKKEISRLCDEKRKQFDLL